MSPRVCFRSVQVARGVSEARKWRRKSPPTPTPKTKRNKSVVWDYFGNRKTDLGVLWHLKHVIKVARKGRNGSNTFHHLRENHPALFAKLKRTLASTLKAWGTRVAPLIPSVFSFTPSGAEENLWSKATGNRNISILASPSPRHTRLPGVAPPPGCCFPLCSYPNQRCARWTRRNSKRCFFHVHCDTRHKELIIFNKQKPAHVFLHM